MIFLNQEMMEVGIWAHLLFLLDMTEMLMSFGIKTIDSGRQNNVESLTRKFSIELSALVLVLLCHYLNNDIP